jgi:hypothetical protein
VARHRVAPPAGEGEDQVVNDGTRRPTPEELVRIREQAAARFAAGAGSRDKPSDLNRCVLCDEARLTPDGRHWIVSMATPPDCEHETLDGRS